MKTKINCVFTLFFIMGFQMQYPVTMFPANSDSSGGQIVEVFPDFNNTGGVLKHIIDPPVRTPEDSYASRTSDKEIASGGYPQLNINSKEHDTWKVLIESTPLGTSSSNENINQAHQGDLRHFNGKGETLNGFERGLSKNQIDTHKSVINRITEDLARIKLEHIHSHLANLSTNLQTRNNILTANNGGDLVNGHKLDKDGSDNDNNNTKMKSRQSQSTQSVTDSRHLQSDNEHNRQSNETNTFVRGIMWSPEIVSKCPQGLPDDQQTKWRTLVKRLEIISIQPGCGSMQNRLITFNDSTQACVRYRLNADQMQGEIYSYYLSKLLDMKYIPATTMHKVDDSEQWRPVRKDVIAAKWSDNKPVIVTKWLESLEPVYMPDKLKDIKRQLHQGNYQLDAMTAGEVCDLVQWSDLIVFDYISANLDRVVNNMFNLKWNPKMLEKPIHNLEKTRHTGQYVFIDNESGLFHGYRLLDSYETYHEQLLSSICVFKPSTIDAIQKLYMDGNAADKLQHLYENKEEFHGLLPRMGMKNKHILQDRIQNVFKHIQMCKHHATNS